MAKRRLLGKTVKYSVLSGMVLAARFSPVADVASEEIDGGHDVLRPPDRCYKRARMYLAHINFRLSYE